MRMFYNDELRVNLKKILNNFKDEPDNLNDELLMPRANEDIGLDQPYIIDVLEEAFFYTCQHERDHDLAELWIQIIK